MEEKFINDLGNYKNIFLKKINKIGIKNNNVNCSICLNVVNEENIGVLKCGHIFCYSCIYKSLKLNKKCPECRSDIVYKDLYLFNTNNNNLSDRINYNLLDQVGTKFKYLFKMIINLKNIIIFFKL